MSASIVNELQLTMDSRAVGILGGGQLGRMMVEAANRLNVKTIVLDAPNSPAKQINSGTHVDGSFSNVKDVIKIGKECDIVTTEIEHVSVEALQLLEKESVLVQPTSEAIRVIQDKFLQKEHLMRHDIPTPDSISVRNDVQSLESVGATYGYPFMLKSRKMAYDGRGNFQVHKKEDIAQALSSLHDRTLYCERHARYTKELAVMVVQRLDGTVCSYPTVETIQRDNICHQVYVPARVLPSILAEAKLLAERTVRTFAGAGVYGVEMFLLADNQLLINEVAPRPHNSGHYTIEACATSQFEAHLRAILGLPITESNLSLSTSSTYAVMVNLLGGSTVSSHLDEAKAYLAVPGATVHMYGKGEARAGRKMGHVTIISSSMSENEYKLQSIMAAKDAQISTPQCFQNHPLVGVIMGSDSDLPKMAAGTEILRELGVPYETRIVSAHRTPEVMYKYAREACSRGIKVIIAAAGGAAHLPGMVAAMTPLPVIGVPIRAKVLDGVDSLHSIVQMPRGVPVATVAIDNSTNAAILATRILATSINVYRMALEQYANRMESSVVAKDQRLSELGDEKYNLENL